MSNPISNRVKAARASSKSMPMTKVPKVSIPKGTVPKTSGKLSSKGLVNGGRGAKY